MAPVNKQNEKLNKHDLLDPIATDKVGYPHNIFLISQGEALLMSTHNICFHLEIRKISAFFE